MENGEGREEGERRKRDTCSEMGKGEKRYITHLSVS